MGAEAKILPLVEPIGSRYASLTVDAKLVNAFAERGVQENEVFVYRRPGFKESSIPAMPADVGRGLFNWNGDIYAIVGGTLYKNGVSLGAVSNAAYYYFAPCLGSSAVLFFHNGTNAYVTDGTTITAVTDPNYPASTRGGVAFLDGTTYVMNSTAIIYGSDAAANDPTAWDPLNTITAQVEPTLGICIAKHLVYVLALKENYTEAFYDAGNATGSPLGTVGGAKMNYGCVDALTVRDVGGDLCWLSSTGEGAYCVIFVSNLKPEVVSTPQIERILSGAAAGAFHSWNVKIEGHRLYAITNIVSNFTLVYDIGNKIWYQWMDASGNHLPYTFSCQGSDSTAYFLHRSNGKIYTLDVDQYIDQGDSPFACQIYTPNYDGGTRRAKTLARMDIIGDQVDTDVAVAISDDDYATWVSGWTIDMSLDRPTLEGLGSFTKRAFRFTHQDDAAFRFKAAEMYIDLAES